MNKIKEMMAAGAGKPEYEHHGENPVADILHGKRHPALMELHEHMKKI